MKKVVKKNSFLISMICIIVLSAIIGTVAYIFIYYSKKNTFDLGIVKTQILEDNISSNNSNSNTKNSVFIKNIGNVSIYIRTSVVIYFENNEGQIIEDVPVKNTDYTINYSNSSDWLLLSDGYYYYKSPVLPNGETEILIDEFSPKAQYEDKKVAVDIVTQAIQSKPTKAVEEAWRISLQGNQITLE